jgi:hypothetical protein
MGHSTSRQSRQIEDLSARLTARVNRAPSELITKFGRTFVVSFLSLLKATYAGGRVVSPKYLTTVTTLPTIDTYRIRANPLIECPRQGRIRRLEDETAIDAADGFGPSLFREYFPRRSSSTIA